MNETIINAILITHLGWRRRCSETPADAPAPEKRSAQSLWWTPAVCKKRHQFSSWTIVAVVVVVGTAVVVSLIKSLILSLPQLSSKSWHFHLHHYHFWCCTERQSLKPEKRPTCMCDVARTSCCPASLTYTHKMKDSQTNMTWACVVFCVRFLKIWNRMRPRVLMQNQHTRELISTPNMQHKYNNKDPSRRR